MNLKAIVPLHWELRDIIACGEINLAIQICSLRVWEQLFQRVSPEAERCTDPFSTYFLCDGVPVVSQTLVRENKPVLLPLRKENSIESAATSNDPLALKSSGSTLTRPSSYSLVIHPFLKFNRSGWGGGTLITDNS